MSGTSGSSHERNLLARRLDQVCQRKAPARGNVLAAIGRQPLGETNRFITH